MLDYMLIQLLSSSNTYIYQPLIRLTYLPLFLFPSGFRIDPPEKLEETFTELKNLHDVFSTCPVFGVDFVFESETPTIDQLLQVCYLLRFPRSKCGRFSLRIGDDGTRG